MRFNLDKLLSRFRPEARCSEPIPTEVLLCRAHDIIEEGWTRGAMQRPKPREPGNNYCTLGALAQASQELQLPMSVHAEAIERISKKIRQTPHWKSERGDYRPDGVIIRFNDHLADGKKDVLNVFCGVINDVRKEHGLTPKEQANADQ